MDKLLDLFNKTSEEAVLSEHGPITDIYVDMDYLQDLKIGALLHRVTVQKELEYILHKIPAYNKRFDYECAKYFPALGISERDILNDLKDDNKIDLICFKAPFTSVYYEFVELLRAIINHNKAVSSKHVGLQIQINVENTLYPTELLSELSLNFKKKFPGITVVFSHDKNYNAELLEYTKKNLLLIYNLEAWLKNEDVAKGFVAEGLFFDKDIISFPYVNPSLIKDIEQYDTALDSTQKQIDIYCDFQYLG